MYTRECKSDTKESNRSNIAMIGEKEYYEKFRKV